MQLHHELINRYRIEGDLVLQTGLHLGSATAFGKTNADIMRDAFGRPFLPGSSLKGAIRSRVEALAHALGHLEPVCFLDKSQTQLFARDGSLQNPPTKCLSTYDQGARWVQEKAAAINTDMASHTFAEELAEVLCPACRLFGGPSWRGKLQWDDLQLAPHQFPMAETRDGVGLDRDTRTAVPYVKYDFEALPSQTVFKLRLVAENLDDENDWPLLAAGLLELCEGHLPLGGKTTRGLGKVRLNNLTILGTDFHQPQDCLAFFTTGAQSTPVPDPQRFLHDCLVLGASPQEGTPCSVSS